MSFLADTMARVKPSATIAVTQNSMVVFLQVFTSQDLLEIDQRHSATFRNINQVVLHGTQHSQWCDVLINSAPEKLFRLIVIFEIKKHPPDLEMEVSKTIIDAQSPSVCGQCFI